MSKNLIGLLAAGLTLALAFAVSVAPVAAAEPAISLNGKAIPYSIWHRLVMPGETLRLKLPEGYSAEVNGETVWWSSWTAPDTAGNRTMKIFDADDREVAQITLFILKPTKEIDDRGYLEGYRIGHYPRNTPKGLIRLEREDMHLPISPTLTIGQFICKQQMSHYPKFLLVSEPNILRLEALLTELRKEGVTDAEQFFVMSGYRTPFYNTAIGSARLSRHMFGDASDVYIDVAPRDGVMDDLNGDNRIDKRDADFLYDFAADLFSRRTDLPRGGLGAYRANAFHGPFLHIDGRGKRARWGR